MLLFKIIVAALFCVMLEFDVIVIVESVKFAVAPAPNVTAEPVIKFEPVTDSTPVDPVKARIKDELARDELDTLNDPAAALLINAPFEIVTVLTLVPTAAPLV
jgi:hypothetical protein